MKKFDNSLSLKKNIEKKSSEKFLVKSLLCF